MTSRHSKGIQGAAWVNILLGVLIFATPFFTGDMAGAALWSNLIVGVAVVAFAAANAYEASRMRTERAYGPAVVNLLLGLWVLVSGFVLLSTSAYLGTNAALGIALAAAAGYNTWASSDARRHVRGPVY